MSCVPPAHIYHVRGYQVGMGGYVWSKGGLQYGVQGGSCTVCNVSQGSEWAQFKDILKHQQDQLNQLTRVSLSFKMVSCVQCPLVMVL